jgi:hypothetical protein
MEVMMRKNLLLIVVLLVVLAMTAAVSAKYEPYMEDAENEWGGVGDTESAAWQAPAALPFYGLYGHLTEGDVDAFAYEFEDSVTAFSIQISVPACGENFVDFYPSMALIGPGLDVAVEDLALPFEVPEGMGVQIFAEEREETRKIDANAGYVRHGYVSTWWSVDIPEGGDYLIAVWEPNDDDGAYVLATGREHPEMSVEDKRESERIRIYDAIEDDSWIGVGCDDVSYRSSGNVS